MWRASVSVSVVVVSALILWGCSQTPQFIAKDEPWRADEERACLASGYVRQSPFLTTRAALGGPSVCGALQPFEMTGAAQGRVTMKPAAMLRCPMIPAIERWVETVIEPAARYHLGVPVTEIKVAASYGCRAMNHQRGARLSEHGHANALDVSGFQLADGRTITLKSGWNGDQRERDFLRSVHTGACRHFTTVLGPDYDRLHHDHFHLDLMRRGSGNVCK